MIKNKFKARSDCYLIQNNDKLELHPRDKNYEPTTETKFLLCFTQSDSGFYLQPSKAEFKLKKMNYEKTWLVLGNLAKRTSQGYYLSEGDQVRLGKALLRVKELKGPKKPRLTLPVQSKTLFSGGLAGRVAPAKTEDPVVVSAAGEEDQGTNCRVCLMDDNDENNPLVKPCKCSGSMGLIHVECLQKWFSTKVAMRELSNSKSYSWKSLRCELCKFDYPEKVAVGTKVFELLLINKPVDNFITLQSDAKNGEAMNINVISFDDKKNIRLGRANDSDVRLSDISVSRNHANISLGQDGLVLNDVKSKFGTLVRVKQSVTLNLGVRFEVQCGRNLIEIVVKKPFRLFSCFGGCGRKPSDDYTNKALKDRLNLTDNNKV